MNLNVESELLYQIIENQAITMVFQAVFDINQRCIYGYEALARGPEDSPLHTPVKLFEVAEQCGKLSELELICRTKAIAEFARQRLPGKLLLNVSPEVLLDIHHPNGATNHILRAYGLSSCKVVIEITERHQVNDLLLKQAVNHYRQLGFDIALDDLGAGHSGLRQWSEVMPDVVKIDRYFIENCHMDMVKKEFIKSIVSLAKATNAKVIAEGIEQEGELKLLASLGVDLIQGFLLQRPVPVPMRQIPHNITELLSPMSNTSKLNSLRTLNKAPFSRKNHSFGEHPESSNIF